MKKEFKVYLITGEQSGDLLGARVMRALKQKTKVHFDGIGGDSMKAEGLKPLFNIDDLSVMGFLEVVPKIPKIMNRLNLLIEDILQKKPDVILTIDAYSFSIRVHQRLKKIGCSIPHAHLVAPHVWAWKKKRAQTIHKSVDYLYCLLPNEPALFRPYKMACSFVGHPVLEGGADQGQANRFRKKYALLGKEKLIGILPGSRHNEVNYLLPVLTEVMKQLKDKIPNAHFVIPTVSPVRKKVQEALLKTGLPYTLVLGEQDRYDAFAALEFAVATSGTVSLELALAKVPHVIIYKMNPITMWLARKFLTIKYANLLNLCNS